MKVRQTEIHEVLVIEPDVFGDERGFFMETWNRKRYAEAGIDVDFRQTNLSRSRKDVLRGLHYQHPGAQGKLVYVLEGEVFDVAVDLRVGSPTFGRWTGMYLSGDNKKQLWIPEGFGHGFCVTSDWALFGYHCTVEYDPDADRSLRFDEPAIGVEWPVNDPELSRKDREAEALNELLNRGLLPEYT